MHMDALQHICQSLLNNAVLRLNLDGQTGVVVLYFTSIGSLAQVQFECSEVHRFKMVKAPDEADDLFVGEVRVTQYSAHIDVERLMQSEGWKWGSDYQLPDLLFHIEIQGGVEIDILCCQFQWQLREKQGFSGTV